MGTPPINQSQPGLNMPQISNGPRIKAEPGLESPHGINQPSPYQNQPMPVLQGGNTAAARAAAHLQQSYGQRAAASINAIQSGGQPQPQQVQQNGQPTMQQLQMMQQRAALAQAQAQSQSIQNQGMQQPRPQMTQEQYQRMMAQNAANRLAQQQQQAQQNGNPQHPQGQNGQSQNGYQGSGPPQTDGPGDDDEVDTLAVIKSGDQAMGRIEIDSLIRAQIESRGRHMEGGGLMLPLKQASTPLSRAALQRQRLAQNRDVGKGQLDGGDEEGEDVKNEELDEDAINSDLDDPDEGLNDEEDEDETMGHIMLCMYDKVQRVKNKWFVLPFFPFPSISVFFGGGVGGGGLRGGVGEIGG